MASDHPDTGNARAIGRAFTRVDGPLKVSGSAHYSSDFHFDGMLVAVPVCAQIASGEIERIDSSAAATMPGVRKIYTRANIGTFYRVPPSGKAKIDERRPPLEDDVIRYYGQYVALVVADTFEQASAAAMAVVVRWRAQQAPNVRTRLDADEAPETDSQRGDPERAFAAAAVTVDHTYTTPIETHNPIELHASVARWDGTRVTLYETTQSIMNHQAVLAQMLGVPTGNVEIVTRFLGSGFGGKLWPWPHSLLAAAAARDLERPVKLVVTRKMMFHDVGHRANTQQRMRLGAERDGRLVSLQQDYLYQCARAEKMKEDCGEATAFLYSTPNLRITSALSRRNMGANTSMRGPGAVPGLFAVESAMDELALALRMDPVELRLRNEPKIDESKNVPFSSRHMTECLTRGAEVFGWSRRDPTIGAMRRDGMRLGWGMAACSWMAQRQPAAARVSFNADGSVRVASGTQDIGTGTYTVIAQMVAEIAGLDVADIQVVIGDSSLPPGPLSGGSMATGSLVPAVLQATRDAIAQLLAAASEGDPHFERSEVADLAFTRGRVHRGDEAPERGRRFEEVLAAARRGRVEGNGKAEGTFGKSDQPFSMHSYGAHFVEVTWQPELARLRVHRIVTVIDAGRIINPLTGRNQIEGALIMGVGMALLERTHYDARNGMATNSNLADYMVPTHADTPPQMDVIFLDYPDTQLNELGARGIGEIGLAGFAAAVTAAVHHATGIRVRDLPVRIEDLLPSKVA